MLKKYKLTIVAFLAVAGLFFDLFRRNGIIGLEYSTANLLQFSSIVIGMYIYPVLRKHRLESLLFLNIISLPIEFYANYLASRGIHNIFLINIMVLVTVFILFFFFYCVLNLSKNRYKILYLISGTASMLFFIYESYSNGNYKLANITVSISSVELIILSWITLFKVGVGNVESKLIYDPLFWICSAIIFKFIIALVYYGLHPYLVGSRIEIYDTPWLLIIMQTGYWIFDLFYFYALCVAGKCDSTRLAWNATKLKPNKALRPSKLSDSFANTQE